MEKRNLVELLQQAYERSEKADRKLAELYAKKSELKKEIESLIDEVILARQEVKTLEDALAYITEKHNQGDE